MAIPEKVQQMIAPDGDPKRKMMAAKGALPLPPNVQIEVLGVLLDDPESGIRTEAQKTLMDMPPNILHPLIPKIEQPKTLHVLAVSKKSDEELMEKLLLSKYCAPQTVEKIAADASEKVCTLIVNNQVRLLKHPEIANVLKKNKNALSADIEKMVSFLKLNGITVEGESAELTLSEIEDILAMPDDDLDETLTKETEAPPSEDEKRGMYQIIQELNTAQKIKLALKGNKEARNILVKDSNKLVAAAVIKNPRITDKEVLTFCLNRSIQEEILRIVCMNPQWVRSYSVQAALANNPKTPFQHALRFTKMLNVNDLKKLSKNKNAHSQIQKMAKMFYQQKRR